MMNLALEEIKTRLQRLWNSCEEGLEFSQGGCGWNSASKESVDGWIGMQEDIELIAKLVTGKTSFEYTGDRLESDV
jgi:hypothetical protein